MFLVLCGFRADLWLFNGCYWNRIAIESIICKIKCFIEREALRRPRTDTSQTNFEENIKNFESRLTERGYPVPIVRKSLSELKFADRKTALLQSPGEGGRGIPDFK